MSVIRVIVASVVLAVTASAHAAQKPAGDPAAIAGTTWRGTSRCTDRVAAPACADETVVYEFKAGARPGVVRWIADKIVAGQRESMGELELSWDRAESCWKAEFSSPRTNIVWRLTVDGTHLTGTGRRLPGNETTRRIDLKKE